VVLRTGLRTLGLMRQALFPSPFPGVWQYLRRVLILVVFLPALLILQVSHWIGFLLDEFLFRRYRRVDVRHPVFVLGVPRSGTTFLHRLLAEDAEFTTFSTWECLFAPSITERYVYLCVAAIDRRIGRPFGRVVNWFEARLLDATKDVHPTSLTAPEEDYLVFLPLLCCFILVVPFPESDWLWRMGQFDRDMPKAEREILLRWYRRCLQKHLYFHGPSRTLLSKNAAFAGMAISLVDAFPDCRLVVCERDAVMGIASQFSSLSAGLSLFGVAPTDVRFRRKLLDCLHFYYENLAAVRGRLGNDRLCNVPLWNLSRETPRILSEIYERIGRPVPSAVEAAIAAYESRSRRSARKCAPPLTQWGLDPDEISTRFARWRQEEAIRI
jgi:hypothetical protein